MKIPRKIISLFDPDLQSRLVELRRDLHQHPELSFQEERTAQKLFDELAQLKPAALDRIAGTGVVARIQGKNPKAPVVAIRGDIDALPIQEATNLEFASQNTGVMHACGHDIHAAWTVGAAYLLTKNPAAGDVLMVLQPAEETGKGAAAILDTGILDSVSAIFGAHVDGRITVGKIVAEVGPLAASADIFRIELIGKGGHGARPHESVDPIIGAGALITALQTIVSHQLNPAQAGVVTVGMVHAGSAPNIIPERATLQGTIRAVDANTRQLLQDEVRRIAEATAEVFKLQANVEIESGTPPIVNPREPVSWARQAVTSLLGEDALVPLDALNMAGEDFALYMERMQGCFLRIGIRAQRGGIIPSHSPHFCAAEESIFIGATVLAEAARVASAKLSG